MRKKTAILFTFTSICIVFCWTAGSVYGQTDRVTVGAERLLTEYDSLVQGKRVGIITNHSAVVPGSGQDRRDTDTLHIIDLIHEDPDVSITALFGPEHGLRGQADAGEAVADSEDELTGAPVYSLYGEHDRPTMEMLNDVDLLIFDMQDVGARFYTYAATMARSMVSAAEAGIPFLVLDRPNPLGGNRIEGFIRKEEFKSGIGLFPTPVTHGMTIGELARMIKGEQWMDGLEELELHVIEMTGWNRDMLWNETGLPWVPPSPNIPDVETALVYPGTCFFEGTTASEGRGTYEPFLQVGARNVEGDEIAGRLNERNLEGLDFTGTLFTPESIPGMSKNPKLLDEEIEGIRLEVTDADALHPVAAGIHILEAFYNALSETDRKKFFNERGMQIRAGNETVQQMLENGEGAQDIIDRWQDDVDSFARQREPYLLYQ
ncbi:MAG: exo-beta-N-acetylmuramidase NamZ domain-containing protein [Balneolaceae bacterium]